MDEKKMRIVLEALAETIEKLRLDLCLARLENDNLKKKLEEKGKDNG